MTNDEMQSVLLYLVDKLDPKSKDEVGELLGGEVPDLGQDAMKRGGKAWDLLPERIKRRAAMSLKIKPGLAQDGKPVAPVFEHAGRLK